MLSKRDKREIKKRNDERITLLYIENEERKREIYLNETYNNNGCEKHQENLNQKDIIELSNNF